MDQNGLQKNDQYKIWNKIGHKTWTFGRFFHFLKNWLSKIALCEAKIRKTAISRPLMVKTLIGFFYRILRPKIRLKKLAEKIFDIRPRKFSWFSIFDQVQEVLVFSGHENDRFNRLNDFERSRAYPAPIGSRFFDFGSSLQKFESQAGRFLANFRQFLLFFA